MTYMERFYKFLALLVFKTPGIQIKFKNESWFMKLLGWLSFFNPKFMTTFTTVVGKTIYFPNREFLSEEKQNSPLMVIAHEYRHMNDSEGFFKHCWYSLGYFFPAVLAPLMLLFLLLPISYAISIPLSIFLFLACFSPIPSYGRKYYELRGYTVNLFVLRELWKEEGVSDQAIHDSLIKYTGFINDQFTTSAYWFMWPFGVKAELLNIVDLIMQDKLVDDEFFAIMRQDIASSRT